MSESEAQRAAEAIEAMRAKAAEPPPTLTTFAPGWFLISDSSRSTVEDFAIHYLKGLSEYSDLMTRLQDMTIQATSSMVGRSVHTYQIEHINYAFSDIHLRGTFNNSRITMTLTDEEAIALHRLVKDTLFAWETAFKRSWPPGGGDEMRIWVPIPNKYRLLREAADKATTALNHALQQ